MWGIDLKVRDYVILKNILENNFRYLLFFWRKKKEFLFNIDIFKYRICIYKFGFVGFG